jgi:hypothetical protein
MCHQTSKGEEESERNNNKKMFKFNQNYASILKGSENPNQNEHEENPSRQLHN